MKPAEIPHFNGGPRSIAENQFPSHIPSPLLDYRNTKKVRWRILMKRLLKRYCSFIDRKTVKNGVSCYIVNFVTIQDSKSLVS